jgi:NADPH:quinone reductase
MRAIVVERWVAPRELVVAEAPEPEAGRGRVVIEVRAAGCNFFDALQVEGKYQDRPPFPFVPGSECAGVVSAVGEDVAGIAPGDRVMAGLIHGAFAERVAVPARRVQKIPDGVSFETAAAFPIVYPTSYLALVDRARLAAGETLLVTAAGGGVGLAAVEIGKALGARVIAATGSEEKGRVAREAGADAAVDYRAPDWAARVQEANGGRGVDVVVDCVGGEIFEGAWKSLAWKGRLVVVGFTSGAIPELKLNRVLLKNASVSGIFLGSYVTNEPATLRAGEDALRGLLSEGKLSPRIHSTYPLEKTGEALEAVASRKTHGKVIVRVSSDPSGSP